MKAEYLLGLIDLDEVEYNLERIMYVTGCLVYGKHSNRRVIHLARYGKTRRVRKKNQKRVAAHARRLRKELFL